VLMEEGNIRDAYVHRALALKNFRNAGATYMEGVGLGNLASLERHLGLLERASQSFQRARDILRRGGRVVEQAVFESSFGQLLLLLGFHDAARVNAQQASDDLMRVGAVNWCAQYATLLEIRLDVDRAAKGSATAVRDARQRLENMRALLTDMPGAEGTGLGRAAAKGNELLQEAQQPEPLLFRGHLVSELEAPLRLALMDRMRRIEPEQWQALQNQPRLLKAFREGTEGLETPDWESTES